MRQAVVVTFVVVIVVVAHVAIGVAQESTPKTDPPIDFKRDIRPIFRRHCYRCHGPHKQEGGLRLDDREHAQLGGTSHESTLRGTTETNPIYQRITSTDPETRMPLKEEPLAAKEIETIASWIRQKTPWPASTLTLPPGSSQKVRPVPEPGVLGWLGGLWDRLDEAFETYAYLKRLVYLALGLLTTALVVEICREARKKERPWTLGRLRPLFTVICLVRVSHCLVLLMSVAIFFGWRDFRSKLDTIGSERAKLHSSLLSVNAAPSNESVYGSPPVPNRPSKLQEISGTYYRGNCERNPKLFNGGNYRTATFHLGLVGADQKQIELGTAVTNVPLSIRFEIERAPKTAVEFFTRKTTDRIYLTENTVNFPSTKPPTSAPVCLETIKPEQSWGGFYPIGTVPDGERATSSGLIYVVVGVPQGGSVVGQIHYGIKYDLIFEDGKIADGSDLWMAELYITTPIAPPRPDKVPLNEWFDYRPIPEITGENTTDPKLLGIDTLSGGPDDPGSK